jgi:hypothetical protein
MAVHKERELPGVGCRDSPSSICNPHQIHIFYELGGSILTLPTGPSFQFIHAPGSVTNTIQSSLPGCRPSDGILGEIHAVTSKLAVECSIVCCTVGP